MSRKATYELALRKAEAYRRASGQERSIILTQMEQDTGYDRKTLIRLMKKARLYPEELRQAIEGKKGSPSSRGRGRPRKYGPRIRDILWDIRDNASIRSSPLLLVAYIRANMDKLTKARLVPDEPGLKDQLVTLSPSTAYRLLKEKDRIMGLDSRPRPYHHNPMRARIPYAINVPRDEEPGHLQADSCVHSGGLHNGTFIHSLTITDLRTGWVMLGADIGLSADGFRELISKCLSRYPVKVKTFQTDGGPEFLNNLLEDYTKRRGIRFIASRPYKSNDQANVEERHHHIVRAFVGRDRLDTSAELVILEELYGNLELLLNLFTPTLLCQEKVRTDSGRLRRKYGEPLTPLQRVLPYLPREKAQELLALREQLNPVDLRKEVKRLQNSLFDLLTAKEKRAWKDIPLRRSAAVGGTDRTPCPSKP